MLILPTLLRRGLGAATKPFDVTRLPGLQAHVRLCWRRAATRRALRRLDARALLDIGVTQEDAEAEAAKPFWRA